MVYREEESHVERLARETRRDQPRTVYDYDAVFRHEVLCRLQGERPLDAVERAELESLQALAEADSQRTSEAASQRAAQRRIEERKAEEQRRDELATMSPEELTVRVDAMRSAFGYAPTATPPKAKAVLEFPRLAPSPVIEDPRAARRAALGANLTRLRTELGWSYELMAEKTGVAKSTLIEASLGRTLPHPDNLKAFADVLAKYLERPITVGYLIGSE